MTEIAGKIDNTNVGIVRLVLKKNLQRFV